MVIPTVHWEGIHIRRYICPWPSITCYFPSSLPHVHIVTSERWCSVLMSAGVYLCRFILAVLCVCVCVCSVSTIDARVPCFASIDGTPETPRLGRLVNHSRHAPNCVTRSLEVDGRPRLVLVAKHDIAVGDEILYDYGDRSRESLLHHPWLAL